MSSHDLKYDIPDTGRCLRAKNKLLTEAAVHNTIHNIVELIVAYLNIYHYNVYHIILMYIITSMCMYDIYATAEPAQCPPII